jgi:hypothetical protein
MSRRRFDKCEEKSTFLGNFGFDNCCCDFSTLIILILIILQFNRRRDFFGGIAPVAADSSDCGPVAPQTFFGGTNLIDNSILFIIALFFLSCCNPCRD